MILFIVIACAVVFLAIAIAIAALLLSYRNKVMIYKEEIRKAKSRLSSRESSYSRQMRDSQYNQHGVVGDRTRFNGMGVGSFSDGFGAAHMYSTGVSMLGKLNESSLTAKDELNELISEYNYYISKFPNLILSAILKYKKEDYVN